MNDTYEYDFFVSHAFEDKDVAEPLVEKLSETGAKVWYDETELTIGDSLRDKIDHGLANSRYGIVILSPMFFEKDWPPKELNGLVAREVDGLKVILPVWHNITVDEIRDYSPILADRLATRTALGLDRVVVDIIRAAGNEDDRTGPTTDVPDIELPAVAQDEAEEATSELGLLLGSSPLHDLEDQAFELVSKHGEVLVTRLIRSQLRALRIALLDNRSVAKMVGTKTSEYILENPERRVKEALDRLPAFVEGLIESEEGEAAISSLLGGVSRLYSAIPATGNEKVRDPLGIQQHLLYSTYAVGAIAVENDSPSVATSLLRWENAPDTYWENRSWIRYVATMLARQNVVGKSIINPVKENWSSSKYLVDTLGSEDDVWNRLCQFDFLQCADVIASGGELEDCFASFSVFRRNRVQPMIETLIHTHDQGIWIPALDAPALARLIVALDEYAVKWAGFEYDAWAIDRWSSDKIRMFLSEQGYEVR